MVSHEPQGWRMGWLPEVFNKGMVSGLSLMVRLVAVWGGKNRSMETGWEAFQ